MTATDLDPIEVIALDIARADMHYVEGSKAFDVCNLPVFHAWIKGSSTIAIGPIRF